MENKDGGNVKKHFVYNICKLRTKWGEYLDEKKLKKQMHT